MTKQRLMIASGLVLLLVASMCYPRKPVEPGPGFSFPNPDDIEQMEASIYLDLSDGATFVVPRSEYEGIFAALSPSAGDTPMKWEILGSLSIGTKDGQSIYLELFDTRAPIGAFSAGPTYESREYYRGGSSPQLRAVLAKAKQAAVAD